MNSWRIGCWRYLINFVVGLLVVVLFLWIVRRLRLCSCRILLWRLVRLITQVVSPIWSIFWVSCGWFWDSIEFYQKLRQIYCILHCEFLWILIISTKPSIPKCWTTSINSKIHLKIDRFSWRNIQTWEKKLSL